MLWLDRFASPTVIRRRVALALILIAAVACADRVSNPPELAATQRASADLIPPTNPFDDLWVSPHREVNAGEAATGYITLKAPAPPGGAHVIIKSVRPATASVDSLLFIPEGQIIQSFRVQTYPVPFNLGANLYADWGSWRVTAAFIVKYVAPPPPPTPSLSVTPANLTFGPLAIGGSSAPQIVTVQNTGAVNVVLYAMGIIGPFTKTHNCPITLVPNASCTVSVVYVPTAGGAQSGSLSVPSSAPSSPNVVTLNGTGVATPAINVTPGAIGFGSVAIGNSTSGRVVKITSTGSAPLVVSSLTLGGANPGDFPIYADGCSGATLNPGASCTAYVSFEPTRVGARSATVMIAHNASGGSVVVPLSGTGTKPAGGYIP